MPLPLNPTPAQPPIPTPAPALAPTPPHLSSKPWPEPPEPLSPDLTQVLLLPPSCAHPGAPTQLAEAWCSSAAAEAAGATGLAEFPFAPSPALLRRVAAVGGYLFCLRPLGNEDGWAVGARGGEAAEGRCLALFLPPGWLHWLVGDGATCRAAAALSSGGVAPPQGAHGWHALFGGSFFPSCHEAHAKRGSPRPRHS